MSNDLELKNPPSVEGVFEFMAPNSGKWDVEEFRALLEQIVDRNIYPEFDIKFKKQFEFETSDSQEPEVASSTVYWNHIDYRSSDGAQVLRFGGDRMSFHRLKPYLGFEKHLSEVKEVWQKYHAIVKPRSVPQIGLRFINRIELPEGTDAQSLSSYLSILPPNAFASEERTVDGILSQVQLSQISTGHKAAISVSTNETSEGGKLAVLLNIQTRCHCDFSPDDEGIWNHFRSLRDWKNKLFLESLEKKCLMLFNK